MMGKPSKLFGCSALLLQLLLLDPPGTGHLYLAISCGVAGLVANRDFYPQCTCNLRLLSAALPATPFLLPHALRYRHRQLLTLALLPQSRTLISAIPATSLCLQDL
jgi:hypothetical protein